MILADKILNLRKKNGWSQEELAQKLNVSRQSISKWEGASSIPDISKVIELAAIFGVSTDCLLKDELHDSDSEYSPFLPDVSNLPLITLDEAIEFVAAKKAQGKKIALGVVLCICSPVLLIFLAGVTEFYKVITEGLAVGLGITALLILVAAAVAVFITSSLPLRKFKNIKSNNFETAYGVIGAISEKLNSFEESYTKKIVVGVMLCILSVVPLIIGAVTGACDMAVVSLTCLMLILVAVAVFLFITGATEKSSYQQILGEGEYTKENLSHNEKFDRFSGFYWPIIVSAYLLWSFISNDWNITWIIWPVAALLFAALSAIFKKEAD